MRHRTGFVLMLAATGATVAGPAAAAPTPTPKAGKRVVVRSGNGRRKAVKVGTTLDATKHSVSVTGKVGAKTVKATFSGARFKLTQGSSTGPLAATLTGGGISCKAPYGKATAKRALRVKATGKVVVKGCFETATSSATGGSWTTTDTPGATKVANAGKPLVIKGATGKTQTLAKGGSLTGTPAGFGTAPAPTPTPPAPPTPPPAPPTSANPAPIGGALSDSDIGYYLIEFPAGTYNGTSVGKTDITLAIFKSSPPDPAGYKIRFGYSPGTTSAIWQARGHTDFGSSGTYYFKTGCGGGAASFDIEHGFDATSATWDNESVDENMSYRTVGRATGSSVGPNARSGLYSISYQPTGGTLCQVTRPYSTIDFVPAG